MPIQIKELVIRATISEGGDPESTNSTQVPQKKGKKGKSDENLLRQCVDEVLEILRLQNER